MTTRDIPSATLGSGDQPQMTSMTEHPNPMKVEPCREPARGVDETLRMLSQQLVDQLDRVHADDRYKGVWQMAWVHGLNYGGPTYASELAALRDFLLNITNSSRAVRRDERCGGNLDRATADFEHLRSLNSEEAGE